MPRLAMVACMVTIMGMAGCSRPPAADAPTDRDKAIGLAQAAFRKAKSEGVDMSRGPCLGDIAPDWCADVAHNPRQPIDDDPANQCASYRSGRVHHFVELDPNGNLIRAE